MSNKYASMRTLIAMNKLALKGGAKAIAPDYLEGLSSKYQNPVERVSLFPERLGWVRCLVGIGTTTPSTEKPGRTFLLDMPEKYYERLPTFPTE